MSDKAQGTRPKRGRPSKYKPEMAEQARKLALLGATDREMSNFFEVAESTFNLWKLDYPDFSAALDLGKEAADKRVEKSLYHRALGYSHDAVKIFADPKTGAEHITHFTEHYPPDTTACIFWLKNRKPEEWRDRQELTGKNGDPLIPEASDNEIARRIAFVLSQGLAKPQLNS